MKIKERLLPLVTLAIVLIVWYLASVIYNIPLIWPKPSVAFKELVAAFGEGAFWVGIGNTMLRAIFSFVLAFVFALLLALAAVKSRMFYKLFYPVVVLLRALPTISVIFICYIALKGWYRAVLIAFLVIFPTLFASFYTAIKNTDGELAEVGRVFGVKPLHVFFKFIIPSVWASMYSDIVNTLSLTVKLIIAAEAVTSTSFSLGGLMAEVKAYIDMGRILAYTVVAIGLSYLTELLVRLITRCVKEVSKKWRLH